MTSLHVVFGDQFHRVVSLQYAFETSPPSRTGRLVAHHEDAFDVKRRRRGDDLRRGARRRRALLEAPGQPVAPPDAGRVELFTLERVAERAVGGLQNPRRHREAPVVEGLGDAAAPPAREAVQGRLVLEDVGRAVRQPGARKGCSARVALARGPRAELVFQ